MVIPNFAVSRTNVPILSSKQIEQLAIDILDDYYPDMLMNPQPLDVDRFLEQYLRVTMDYKFLTHCRLYLGMTVFSDTDKVPVYNPEKDRAEYITCKARTVILDNCLLDESQEHRYAFTGAHEGAHVILHSNFFGTQRARTINEPPIVQCQAEERRSGRYGRTDSDWLEWQADTLGAALLMPLPAVQRAVARAKHRSRSVNYAQEAIQLEFNVSCAAAGRRCTELIKNGYLK